MYLRTFTLLTGLVPTAVAALPQSAQTLSSQQACSSDAYRCGLAAILDESPV
jgi:hypothetical protein